MLNYYLCAAAKPMNVVTISRQLGSLGFEIGKMVAEQMEYRLVWRELINQAAIRAGAPDVALAMIDELNLLGICPSPEKCSAYITAVGTVLIELAQEGNVVIVGRGGQVVLKDRPEVLHVRIIAPLDLRIARVAQTRKVNPEAALAQIHASDRTRRQYFQRFYQTQWEDPAMYDLIINSGRISVAAAARLICTSLALPTIKNNLAQQAAEDSQV